MDQQCDVLKIKKIEKGNKTVGGLEVSINE